MNQQNPSSQTSKVYSVSQLNTEARLLLEGHFLRVWVSGELSNLAMPQSGHLYFSLKDERAQVRCALFRTQKNRLSFAPDNGMQVLLQAKVSLYEGRGDYQLIVDHMEPLGEGALRLAFERLKAKLSAEGLFDAQHKKNLPRIPQAVGVITSSTGAAIRDIVSVLKRRFPAIKVYVYPCEVQGQNAARSINNALQTAIEHDACDVFIIGRGGGSLEDLQAFNDEALARAVFACPTPVVSGIGHEIDTTIVDYVADQRAATPTAAAELVSPEQSEWLQYYQLCTERLSRAIGKILQNKQQALEYTRKRLRHPQHRIIENTQRLDHLQQRLMLQIKHLFKQKQQQLANVSRALDAISPLATLQRGYAIVSNEEGTILRDAAATKVGDTIKAQLAKGYLVCEVKRLG